MPRPRKPLVRQKGHLTVAQREQIKVAEKSIVTGREQLETPPDWLCDEIAVEEWKRVVEELRDIEIIGNLDVANIGVYCNAFSDYVKATDELRTQPRVIERETRQGTILVENPWVKIQKSYSDEVRKAGSKCGIDVDSRLKNASIKQSEVQSDIDRKFGLI